MTHIKWICAAIVATMLGILLWPKSPPDVYKQTVASVVKVSAINGGGSGSGVIVATGRTTLVITNQHVVENGPMQVHWRGETYPAITLKVDKETDLALLVVHATLTPIAHYHPIGPLKVFDEVILVGAGRGLPPYPTKGIISLTDHEGMYQVSAAIVGGMSGGAVWRFHNNHYELIGIIRAMGVQSTLTPFGPTGTPVNNIGYIIKMETIFKFMEGKNAQR